MNDLVQILQQVEETVGTFSSYGTSIGRGEFIDFNHKPAQKFLLGVGATHNAGDALSFCAYNESIPNTSNPDVVVSGWDDANTVTIAGKRVDRLVRSARIFVNSDLVADVEEYKKLLAARVSPQYKGKSAAGIYWQNLAVGICHSQEIDLLVAFRINDTGEAIAYPRNGTVAEEAPALLLLSSPALNFAYGVARNLKNPKNYIEGMFANLFNAALSQGREYIAMPAAGLGVFGGKPEMYFEALMHVAKSFPKLNVIYHPAGFGKQFDAALAKHKPKNVIRASKDVMVIADALTQSGKPCAFHNPSDSDVMFGVYDVGEYWKKGQGAGYVGEEHIGAMTTAPVNSYLMNSSAYATITTYSMQNEITQPRDGFFKPKVKPPTNLHPDIATVYQKSCFSHMQLDAILKVKDTLANEYTSCWLYPNKALKKHKILALADLLLQSIEDNADAATIIAEVKVKFPLVLKGRFSRRTAELFASLEEVAQAQAHI